jgi:tRNA G26 N,N-dimethylase Trm1
MQTTTTPQVALGNGDQKTIGANAGNSVLRMIEALCGTGFPIIRNANAVKFGFKTKLVPVYLDGVQTAWEEMHVNSQVEEVRHDSPEALRAAGLRVPFVDYDPITVDLQKPRRDFRPVWTGD